MNDLSYPDVFKPSGALVDGLLTRGAPLTPCGVSGWGNSQALLGTNVICPLYAVGEEILCDFGWTVPMGRALVAYPDSSLTPHTTCCIQREVAGGSRNITFGGGWQWQAEMMSHAARCATQPSFRPWLPEKTQWGLKQSSFLAACQLMSPSIGCLWVLEAHLHPIFLQNQFGLAL